MKDVLARPGARAQSWEVRVVNTSAVPPPRTSRPPVDRRGSGDGHVRVVHARHGTPAGDALAEARRRRVMAVGPSDSPMAPAACEQQIPRGAKTASGPLRTRYRRRRPTGGEGRGTPGWPGGRSSAPRIRLRRGGMTSACVGTMCRKVAERRLVAGTRASNEEGAVNRQTNVRVRVTRRPAAPRDTRGEIDRRTPSGRILPY